MVGVSGIVSLGNEKSVCWKIPRSPAPHSHPHPHPHPPLDLRYSQTQMHLHFLRNKEGNQRDYQQAKNQQASPFYSLWKFSQSVFNYFWRNLLKIKPCSSSTLSSWKQVFVNLGVCQVTTMTAYELAGPLWSIRTNCSCPLPSTTHLWHADDVPKQLTTAEQTTSSALCEG